MRTSVYRERSPREAAPPAGMHPQAAGLQPWMQSPMEAAFGWPAYGATSPARIYLVAVERETFPPLAFGNSMLQHMRVVPVPQDFPCEPGDASLPAPRSPAGDLVAVEQPPAPKVESSRKLFSDPGPWRALRWGEFRGLLAGQIAHPERLRDEHRLPCYVQVVEAGAREPVTELARSVFGDAAVARHLVGLSRDAAVRLELQDMLPPRRQRPPQPREPGVVLPGDRLFRLLVANDPTADVAPAASSKKRELPEPFASQTFPRTRDEVLLEMRMPARASDRLSGWIRSLFSRGGMDRWLRTLWGKSPDDQLWAMAPPSGMLADTAVREWAAATLEMAGYDAPAMLREWEIYWRRKQA